MLADVPANSEGKIDRDFLYWEKGTDRKVIWNWFDQNHSLGIGYLNETVIFSPVF